MPPQYYNGPNFGYIVAFKPQNEQEWKRVAVADAQAKRYVHKVSDVAPMTEFQVKVKAFNSHGEGPYSLTAIIYSAQDGEHMKDSQLSAAIGKKALKWSRNNITDEPGSVLLMSGNEGLLGALSQCSDCSASFSYLLPRLYEVGST